MKPFPMTLEIKTAESDKDKMLEEFHARSEAHKHQQQKGANGDAEVPVGGAQETEIDSSVLPGLQHTEEPHEDSGWIKFDKPVLYL